MPLRRIIDFHTHAFPDPLAERTMTKLREISGCTPCTDGTLAGLQQYLTDHSFAYAILLPIANRPGQFETVNNWAVEACRQDVRLLAFGSIHPKDGIIGVEALSRFASLGLKGVKFHPDYQDFFVDDPCMDAIYTACGALQLPVLFHAGWDPLSPEVVHASPKRLASIVHAFPNTTFIAAHLAGMKDTRETLEHLIGLPLYLDLSMACTYLSPENIAEVIRAHGAHRILFATDCPWGDATRGVELLEALPLSEEDRAQIFFNNAAKLLGL